MKSRWVVVQVLALALASALALAEPDKFVAEEDTFAAVFQGVGPADDDLEAGVIEEGHTGQAEQDDETELVQKDSEEPEEWEVDDGADDEDDDDDEEDGHGGPLPEFAHLESLPAADRVHWRVVDADRLHVTVEWQGRSVALEVRRVEDLYHPDAVVQRSDGAAHARNDTKALHTFMARVAAPEPESESESESSPPQPQPQAWMVVSLVPNSQHVHVTYSDSASNVVEFGHHSYFRRELGGARYRRLTSESESESESEEAYYVVEHGDVRMRAGKCGNGDSLDGGDGGDGGDARRALEGRDPVIDAERSTFAFYPNCFPNDLQRHVVDIGVGTSRKIWQRTDEDLDRVQAEVEAIVTKTSAIWVEQFNTGLRIIKAFYAGDKVPSSWNQIFKYDSKSCPGGSRKIFDASTKDFPKRLPDDEQAGSWMYFHGCNTGISGWAQGRSLCQYRRNGAMSKFLSFRTASHEMGHSIAGMGHSFQNGRYNTGGIMDYGGGKLRGVNRYLYNSLRRPEVCFRWSTNGVQRCRFFGVATGALACGDKFLAPDEQCECANGSTSCPGCTDCQLTGSGAAARECSRSTFYMHPLQNAALASPYAGDLPSPQCCSAAGVLQPSSAACTTVGGTSGRCSNGYCADPCAAYGMEECGSAGGGCQVRCKPAGSGSGSGSGACSAEYGDLMAFVGDQAAGSKCGPEQGQWCVRGACVATTPGAPQEPVGPDPRGEPARPVTAAPTGSPTAYPTTPHPTLFPTRKPTPKPTPRPTTFAEADFAALCDDGAPKCKAKQRGIVRYGNKVDGWSHRPFGKGNTFACAPNTFKRDPALATTAKALAGANKCQFLQKEWAVFDFVSVAKQEASVEGPGMLQFGKKPKFVYKVLTAPGEETFTCNAGYFGIDPAPGKSKKCFFFPFE